MTTFIALALALQLTIAPTTGQTPKPTLEQRLQQTELRFKQMEKSSEKAKADMKKLDENLGAFLKRFREARAKIAPGK